MKKLFIRLAVCGAFFALCFTAEIPAHAQGQDIILTGVYVEDMDISGMTEGEAAAEIEAYVESLSEVPITLVAANGEDITVSGADLGLTWENTNIVSDAAGLGKKGNPIQRYKEKMDLAHESKVYEIELSLNQEMVRSVIEEKCVKYDIKEIDYTLKRENGQFSVVEGQIGYVTDVDASIAMIEEYLTGDWTGEEATLNLVITESQPKGSAEELANVTDVLGSFTTDYHTSTAARCANVANGCNLVNGTTVYPGDTFSLYDVVSPFTAENGYYMAGAYLSGRVVDSIGGGICQVSTTLYNAVLLSELEVTERHNHSMIVTYVEPSADAAISESAGKDFQFVNNTDNPIYIEGYTTTDKKITFTIYGLETRDTVNRQVRYESVVLSTDVPDYEVIYTDPAQPVGYVSVQSAHIGYKAQLWKIVTENGVEVSRTQVNSSNYAKSPRSATVGTSTGDPNVLAQLNSAIATNSIDYVRGVASALATGGEIPVYVPPVTETTAPADSGENLDTLEVAN